MGKVSQLESMVKVLQEDLKKVHYYLLTWKTRVGLPFVPVVADKIRGCITTRRRTQRRRCRHRLKACERTTSGWWRSPTAPRPSWRSSRSGSSTPSTWTNRDPRTPALTTFYRAVPTLDHISLPSRNSWFDHHGRLLDSRGKNRGVEERAAGRVFHFWTACFPSLKSTKKKSLCSAGSKVFPAWQRQWEAETILKGFNGAVPI